MNYVIGVITAVMMIGSFGVLVWRVLGNAGVKLPKLMAKLETNEKPATASECWKVFGWAMLFRVAVFVVSGLALYLIANHNSSTFDFDTFMFAYKKWDAKHYVSISSEWYHTLDDNNNLSTLAFFPLYPFLLSIVKGMVSNAYMAGIILSSVLYSAGCAAFYMLLRLDYKKSVAEKAVVLISVFPFSFFFGTVMTESLFFLMCVLTLYATRKHNWMLAGILGLLTALTRSAGVFLIIPATVEFAEHYKIFERKIGDAVSLVLKKWTWLLLLPVGTCIYLYINYAVSGNAFEFLRLQEEVWHHESSLVFETVGSLYRIIRSGYTFSSVIGAFIPGLVFVLGVMTLMVLGLKKHRSMYTVWLWIYIVVNTSISWPISLPRYLSCAIPAFIILADILDDKEHAYTFTVSISSILFAVYLAGYLIGRQVV